MSEEKYKIVPLPFDGNPWAFVPGLGPDDRFDSFEAACGAINRVHVGKRGGVKAWFNVVPDVEREEDDGPNVS